MPVPRGHVLVRFTSMVPPFNTGEQAAMPFQRARQLVRIGSALYVDPPAGLSVDGAPVADPAQELPEGIVHKGGGYYEIGETGKDGEPVLVKGKAAALKRYTKLHGELDDDDGGGGDGADAESGDD